MGSLAEVIFYFERRELGHARVLFEFYSGFSLNARKDK